MGSFEATNVVLSRIKNIEPENASKIMGYLLMNLEDSELLRLACSPDPVLHTIIPRVKTHLGLSLTPSSPSTAARPISTTTTNNNNPFNPFSKVSPRIPTPTNGFDFSRNPFSLSGLPKNHPISPTSSSLLSYENIRAGSSFQPRVNNGEVDLVDEQQVNEFFPFLNEPSNNDDVFDPHLEPGIGGPNWHSVNNGDAHFHRRSFSASDACFGCEEGGGSGIGFKPCLYFARGFCKNGSNCKFVHVALPDSPDTSAIVGSPGELMRREELLRFKVAQHQRLLAASQLVAGTSPSSHDKYIDFLMQQQNDPQRVAAAASAFNMGEEFCNFSRGRMERNDFLAMFSGEKTNSASRQIYLTFPAESTFKDEDVSEYFR